MGRRTIGASQHRTRRHGERYTRGSSSTKLEFQLIALVLLVIFITIGPLIIPLQRQDVVGNEEVLALSDHESSGKVKAEKGAGAATVSKQHEEADPGRRLEILRKTTGTLCRLPHMCILRNGSATLPLWLRSHTIMIERNCGMHNLEFRLDEDDMRGMRKVEYDLVFYGTLMRDLQAFVKVAAPRGYFRFARVVVKAVLGDGRSTKYICWTNNGEPCRGSKTTRISPVMLHNSSESMDESFEQNIEKRFGAKLSVLEPDTVFSFTDQVCFRSYLVTDKGQPFPSPAPTPPSPTPMKRIGEIAVPWRPAKPSPTPIKSKERRKKFPTGGAEGPKPPEIPLPIMNEGKGNVDFDRGGIEYFWFKKRDKVAACRFHRACFSEDGRLYIPEYLKGQLQSLTRRCGLHGSKIDLSGYYDDSHSTANMDLFNDATILPNTAPDFVHAFLPAMTSLAALYGAENGLFTRRCVTVGGGFSRACPKESRRYRLAMFLNRALFLRGRRHHWVSRFVQDLVPPKPQGPVTLNWNSFKHKVTCFRSVLVVPDRYPPSEILSSSHIFYRANGLNRTKLVSRAKYQQDEDCHLRILALNGHAGNIMVNGEESSLLTNLDAIEHEVTSRGSGTNFTRFGGVTSSITDHYPDMVSLNTTIQELQRSNVILMGYGTGIMNFLFLRRQVLVVEVVPFGLRTPLFHQFSRACDVRLIRIVARPDERGLIACLGQKNREILKSFRKVVKHVGKLKRNEGLFYKDEDGRRFAECGENHEGKLCRKCLKEQRLLLDAGQMAWLLLREGVRVCYDSKIRYRYP